MKAFSTIVTDAVTACFGRGGADRGRLQIPTLEGEVGAEPPLQRLG